MRVLVACEFSGVVRDAFLALGHDAYSCDLLQSESNKFRRHFQCDVRQVLELREWDLMIAHPPCTYLANSGAKHLYAGMKKANGLNRPRWDQMEAAIGFFMALQSAPIPRIAIENPIMHGYASTQLGKPDQIVQPWMFGHGETKATCFWLKGLPRLLPTNIVDGRKARVHRQPPSQNRWKERSRTLPGIAAAMAQQWA
jgi:hypothetical protein